MVFRRSSLIGAFRFCNRDQDAAGEVKDFKKNLLKVLFRNKKRFTFALPIGREPYESLVYRRAGK